MSYDDLSDVETGSFTTSSSEFIELTNSITEKIATITANVSLIHRFIGLHRTIYDTEKLRSCLMEVFTKTREISKELVPAIRQLAQWDDIGPSEKYEQQKLTGEFQRAITDFQHAQRLAVEKQVDYVKYCRNAIEEERVDCETQRRRHSHRHLDYGSQGVIDLDERLLEGRERDIKNIEQGIKEINELFRDFSYIIVDQGSISSRRHHCITILMKLGFLGEDRTSGKVCGWRLWNNLCKLGWTLFFLCLIIGVVVFGIIASWVPF